MIEETVKRALGRCRDARARGSYAAPHIRAALTAKEKREVDELWGGVWPKPDYGWHEHYKAVNGEFDARYVPKDVFYLDMLPRLTNTALSTAWADKAYYPERFPDTRFPVQLLACIDGNLYGGELKPMSWEEAWAELMPRGRVFVKPSVGSSVGRGAFKLDMGDVPDPSALEAALSGSGLNYVVQELVVQNEAFAALNESSLNIIRVNSVRLGREQFFANAAVRFGVPGCATDITFIDGREVARFVGLDREGCMRGFYCDQDGNRGDLADLGIGIGGGSLPGYAEALEMCAGMHGRLHHFGIAAFDVAVDRNGEPVAIEVNLRYPGVVFYQYANGPFFGDRTQDVLGWCRGHSAIA